MATQDVRLELIQHEYTGMRNAVHTLMDRMDGYESALLGLTEAVSQNQREDFRSGGAPGPGGAAPGNH